MKTFFNEKKKKAECFFCGQTQEMPNPKDAMAFSLEAMIFERKHQKCKAANEENPLFS